MVTFNSQSLPPAVSEICQKHHVHRLSLFGSAARGELGPDSDIDLLAEFEPAHLPSYFELVQLTDQLRPPFGDRPIDLVTRKSLHRLFRDEVLRQARVLYEG